MQFGPFVLQNSDDDPRLDGQIIDRTLREAELADELGYDVLWLGEHHFDGTQVFADPIVFGTAVALRTKRIKIGFSVVQISLHHPVRLAVQTAVLDNLSHGRLIVGTARGSGGSLYEYTGFGITIEDGFDSVQEAEELLVKAWTGENVDFQGKYWTVAFPRVRPIPYQKPHPPMPRACSTDSSLKAMARIGRPILLGSGVGGYVKDTPDKRQMEVYKETMSEAGFTKIQVEDAVNQSWLFPFRALYVADSNEQAREEAVPAALKEWTDYYAMRAKLNAADRQTKHPSEYVKSMTTGGGVFGRPNSRVQTPQQGGEAALEHLIAGSPDYVAEKIAEQRESGLKNLLFPMSLTGIPEEKVAHSMRLFAEKVAPKFRRE